MELPETLMIEGVKYVREPIVLESPKDPTEDHQPLPWEFDDDGTQLDADGDEVEFYSGKLAAANCAFDLRAVNNHYDLVKFVEHAEKYGYSLDPHYTTKLVARELLAQVKKS